ncbi:XkdQ/YqbQ family protein [Anoxybacillus kestanbolensis]|uniref:XkdQ/YqbQ family protein n=1 Tax=Anoxybacillus kestanbolensis TaxID=227476 RepID=UPI003D230882
MKVIYDNYDITDLVRSVEWSGDLQQVSRSLTVTLINTSNGTSPLLSFKNGKIIRFFDDKELFRGFLFKIDKNQAGEVTLTCYDANVYLLKNADTMKFVKKKASEIIKHICSTFKIPIGPIADTGYVIPKHIFREKTLAEMSFTALTTTRKHNGRRFFISNDLGKLTLVEMKVPNAKLIIESGRNLLSLNVSESIEETKTKVKVMGGTDQKPVVVTVQNNDLMKQYGIMQHIERADEKLNKAQLQKLANQLLKDMGKVATDMSLESLGINEVRAGSVIQVYNKMTGINGFYYVNSDTHHYENGIHTMSLNISHSPNLAEVAYEEV